MSYRVTRKWISRVEDDERVRYTVGETFEPTDEELDAYGDRLEEVDGGDGGDGGDGDEETDSGAETDNGESAEGESFEADLPDVRYMNLDEIDAAFEGETFSEEEAERLHARESEGHDRLGAHDRIDDHAEN